MDVKSVVNHSFHGVAVGSAAHKRDAKAKKMSAASFIAATFRAENARELGKGSYGVVYAVTPSALALKALTELSRRLSNVVGTWKPSEVRGPLIVKVAGPEPREAWAKFVERSVRENAAHVAAHRTAPDVVPALHVSGSTSAGLFITVMDIAPGVTLSAYLESTHRTLPHAVYAALERAILRLWRAGIVHGDLHDENVLIDMSGSAPRVSIIDFGFAVQLPPDMQRKIAPDLSRHDIQGAWDKIEAYVDAVQLKRITGLSWYNPNAKALSVWRGMVKERSASPEPASSRAKRKRASSGHAVAKRKRSAHAVATSAKRKRSGHTVATSAKRKRSGHATPTPGSGVGLVATPVLKRKRSGSGINRVATPNAPEPPRTRRRIPSLALPPSFLGPVTRARARLLH